MNERSSLEQGNLDESDTAEGQGATEPSLMGRVAASDVVRDLADAMIATGLVSTGSCEFDKEAYREYLDLRVPKVLPDAT